MGWELSLSTFFSSMSSYNHYYLVWHFSIALYLLPHYLADLAPAWRACSILTWRWRLLRFLLRLSTTGGLVTLLLAGRAEAGLLSCSVTRSSPWLPWGHVADTSFWE